MNAPHSNPGPALPALALTETAPGVQTLARSLVGLFCLLLVFLGFTPWQQNVGGLGRVVAYAPLERQQTVQAPVEGRVSQWWVREGTKVKAGDRLAEISDNDPELPRRLEAEYQTLLGRIATIEGRIGAVENQVRMAGQSRDMAVGAAEARVRMAEERLRAARQAVDAAQAGLATSQLNLDRQQALLAKGLTATRTYELARLEQTQRRTELERAKAALKAADSEVEAIRADRRKTGADTESGVEKARADLNKSREELAYAQAEKLKLETRLNRQRTQVVTAPRDGTVLRLAVSSHSELVKPGDPLAVLVPDTQERAVELWVDGNDAPLITPGRKVRLQFEGYPAVQFSGWPEVAVGTFGGVVGLIDATDNGQGQFRLLVVPDPADTPWPGERFLRQGVRANGWVLLNQVCLGYEFWRIFNGFPPTYLPSHPPWEQKAAKTEKSGDYGKEEK
ncbi:Multidrug resistance efflux pump [Methylomagnum ishizawai]|uniref:Multidrug resistance efflux pump n=1 Tax=Methylomagnum ishizawai TaxID=1760988 RepID=A0A1Y6DBL2_9GAMM|nr:HlyD family efflux transporter periplasmic adaptor subunit [Methylomagnum ishizawai]SMF97642.1 Multidrug resistance efflux pump [Methylomagnum ishizawai]